MPLLQVWSFMKFLRSARVQWRGAEDLLETKNTSDHSQERWSACVCVPLPIKTFSQYSINVFNVAAKWKTIPWTVTFINLDINKSCFYFYFLGDLLFFFVFFCSCFCHGYISLHPTIWVLRNNVLWFLFFFSVKETALLLWLLLLWLRLLSSVPVSLLGFRSRCVSVLVDAFSCVQSCELLLVGAAGSRRIFPLFVIHV